MDWNSFESGATLTSEDLSCLLDTWDSARTCGFTTEVRYFDFVSYGKPFTQVAVVLEPERPLVANGRRVYLAASEGGHDNGRELIVDYDGEEAIGPWLARRGVTVIVLCRIGRWNFLTDRPLGSWFDIPLEERVPLYSRAQTSHWGPDQYEIKAAEEISSSTGSLACRVARPGSELEASMMAATPLSVVTGFRQALGELLPETRAQILLLYWGFSTGGPYMWALSKVLAPDGVAGYGMTNFPVARFAAAADGGRFSWLYEHSACRIRERGKPDFLFYAAGMTEAQIERRYQEALHSPRFKSTEDPFMFFNVAALTEALTRLSRADFLPAEIRAGGLPRIFQENIELCYPDEALHSVKVLELFGTRDEIMLGTRNPMRAPSITGPYCKRYMVAFLEGLHHCTDAEHSRTFGSVWLDAIHAGYF
jgi:hypothetical protein